ncbi:hypothetical protein GUITHDRAFT_106250 [Guillardia theta CCMP2712]|uniref:Uncharacterized protein n=1 Tax=Guillardia theta (strain CCMP2712) TaxID=905079 RepID=L1JJA8_GUITC|nr:hypothetical protein GUITHDRAFT_106250 [Guillardia theta CCMP2712]EKX48175.1 hypothetical protein GUITHDRAFT_106250 [Guillardia theta CCMP2712]|eukprot:XP_005835155.1 hypothetical protein GUITHDRAFT_106250 [Guillardia theta CCMP2712]
MASSIYIRRRRSSVLRNGFYQNSVELEKQLNDSVNKQLYEVKDAVINASYPSLFYSSQPIVTSLTRASVQAFFLVIAFLAWKETVQDYLHSTSHGIENSRRLRFTVIELEGEACAAVTNVNGVLLLLEGRPVMDGCVNHQQENSLIIECRESRRWNSWMLNHTRGTKFPVRFYLEDHDATEMRWKVVGSSSYMTYASRHIYFHGRFSPRSTEVGLHEFSNKPSCLQYLHMLHPLITGISMTTVAFCGMLGRELWGKKIMKFFGMSRFAVTCLLLGVELSLPPPNGDKSITYHAMLLANGVFTVCFLAKVKREELLASLVNTGVMLTLTAIVLAGYHHRGFLSPAISLGLYGIVILVFPVYVICYRVAISFQAHSLVLKDKQAYDEVWEAVAANSKEQILQLLESVDAVQETIEGDYLQYSKRDFQTSKKLEVNLDDLYDAAREVLPLLRSKVVQVASGSGGMLPVQIVDGGIHYMKIHHQSSLELFWVKWASLKSRRRSVEKIVRTYSGDVYKLTDVARQSIIFHDVEALVTCLRLLQQDPDIQIVRVKNRLDPDHASWQTAGYRDLMLKLRFVSKPWHTCELQCILWSFHQLKSCYGHQRYVEFRNILGT